MTEAQVSEPLPPRMDWKLPVFLVVMNLIGMGVLWGINSEKIEELTRSRDAQERHMEAIDRELLDLASKDAAGQAFQAEMLRTFQSIDKRLAVLESRPR